MHSDAIREREMTILESNLAVLRDRYPALARRLDAMPDKNCVKVFKARDGGVAYGIRKNGHVRPITDSEAPLARIQAQFDQWASQLADQTRPVLVVGLYPGNELFCLFDNVEQNQTPHCPQPVWVCVDSTYCLYGFLSTRDARRVLEAPRVNWFWHDEMPAKVKWLGEHPEFPHVFTLITGAGDATLNQVMPPLAELVQQRDAEMQKLIVENKAYYDAVSDEELAKRIAHGVEKDEGGNLKREVEGSRSHPSVLLRKPRLLMPTCSWSTFIQHSARDTCAAFEEIGWDVRILKVDAMLTPYYMAKAIHDFKPDIFLFIDHMRYEAEEVYPKNMMFVTWIQDDMPNLQCRRAGDKFAEYSASGKRDLVVGYTDDLDTRHGYPADRLLRLVIPANPRIFHPVSLTSKDIEKHGCDLAFVTNTSMPSEQVIEQKILPEVEHLGISRATCMQIHDDLWKLYRSEKTVTDPKEFLHWLMQYPEFADLWNRLFPSPGDLSVRPSLARHSPEGTTAAVQNPELHTKDARSRENEAAGNSHGPQSTAHSPQPTVHSLTSDGLFRLFYWRLNDTIYRHVVLEWADELGVDLHLYGRGWENHPKFAKYARGAIDHGSELNIAYQAARRCLHLNIAQGMHQRIHEIMASNGSLLVRTPKPIGTVAGEPPRELMRRLASAFRMYGYNPGGPNTAIDLFRKDLCRTGEERDALADWVFSIAFSMAQHDAANKMTESGESLAHRVMEGVQKVLASRLEWNVDDPEQHCFTDRQGFAHMVQR